MLSYSTSPQSLPAQLRVGDAASLKPGEAGVDVLE